MLTMGSRLWRGPDGHRSGSRIEEKLCGMTLGLGYALVLATASTPASSTSLGYERFLHNMVAAAAGGRLLPPIVRKRGSAT